jgi:hypothetical protein
MIFSPLPLLRYRWLSHNSVNIRLRYAENQAPLRRENLIYSDGLNKGNNITSLIEA